MTYMFTAILLTSLIGTILSLVLLISRPFTRRVFSAGWHYYIWLVVLVVMMIPVRVNFSVDSVSDIKGTEPVSITENRADVIQHPKETQMSDYENIQVQNHEYVPAVTENVREYFEDNIYVMSFVWLSVALLVFCLKIIRYWIFTAKLYKFSEPVSCPEIKEYTNRKIKTRISEKICTPLVAGMIKPVLLLPKGDFTSEQLNNILAHESTHINRNDILYKWFVNIVKCVHWFNPMIYYISRQINVDCEISCDIYVTRNMEDGEKCGYVDTILSLLSDNNSKAPYLTTGMTGKKNILKKRFTMIKNKINISRKRLIISAISAVLLLVTALCAGGVLNGKIIKDGDKPAFMVSTDEQKDDKINLLFAGIDNNDRVDTIMLFKVDKDSVSCISIPRNTVYEGQSISSIMRTDNGDQKIIDVIKKNLHVPIHYYARMNLSAVKEIVDCVGGIDFDIPMDMVYEDPYQDLYINLKKGVHTLNGDGVTQLLQYRQGYPRGDMDRIELHQRFIKEFISQKLNKENIDKVPEIVGILSDNMQTNIPVSKLSRILKIIADIPESDYGFEIINGQNSVSDGQFKYEIKKEKTVSKSYDIITENQKKEELIYDIAQVEAADDFKKTATDKAANLQEEEHLYGFEHQTIKDTDINKIEQSLLSQGSVEAIGEEADLRKNYFVGDYSDGKAQVIADEDGKISLYLSVNMDTLFDVQFLDKETNEDAGGYRILANNENKYSFYGFEKGKTYSMELSPRTRGDWVIEGDYIVY
ncbi:MAG: hypothetical protein E7396_09465 [Ruminococcaceae bacterium]|nr:hypothetical protein [Oscillospiraceae bacterium]